MRKLTFLLLTLSTFGTFASLKNKDEYLKARKQYILEYTVFGVDECLKDNFDKIVVDEHNLSDGKILVGSTAYFQMLEGCFTNIKKNSCKGDRCIVRSSMSKRLENVRYVDNMLLK